MTGTDGEVVYTEDTSSHRIHKRIREGGRLLVDEACNLDQAGAYRVLTQREVDAADMWQLCERDFANELLARTAAEADPEDIA